MTDDKMYYIFLDEVQNLPEFQKAVDSLVSKKIKPEIAEKANLKDALIDKQITVEDIETGITSVIFGANKSKLTSNSQLVT